MSEHDFSNAKVIYYNPDLNRLLLHIYELRGCYYNVQDGEDFQNFSDNEKDLMLESLHNEINAVNEAIKEVIKDVE